MFCSRAVFDFIESASDEDSHSSIGSDSSKSEAVDGVAKFGFHPQSGEEAELNPVVELWYELTDHIKNEDIPHPSELYAERDRIIRCARFPNHAA